MFKDIDTRRGSVRWTPAAAAADRCYNASYWQLLGKDGQRAHFLSIGPGSGTHLGVEVYRSERYSITALVMGRWSVPCTPSSRRASIGSSSTATCSLPDGDSLAFVGETPAGDPIHARVAA